MKFVCLLSMLFIATLSHSQDYLIRNITVIPMNSETVLSNKDVAIKNGKISSVTDAGKTKLPPGSHSVDGSGKFLIPGLFDMHAHFFYEQGSHVNTNEKELKLMLANGLTTVRIMAGHPSYLEAKQNTKLMVWAGPELFIASPQFVGRWPWPAGFKNFEIADTKEKAADAVRKYKSEGYDEIKLTFMIRPEIYHAIIKTAKEVNIKVVGHVGPQVKLPAALATGQQIEHMDEFIDMLLPDTSYNRGESVSDMNIWRRNAWATVPYLDEARMPLLVNMVKKAGVAVTPTNYFFISCFGEDHTEEEIKNLPAYKYIPAALLEDRWKTREHYLSNHPPKQSRERYVYLRKKMVYELWKAGVPLMTGSDSPEWFLVQGIAVHDELETFVKAGLTPFAALQTATLNPAAHFGIQKRTGTIEAGKEADLIILDKNPLEDIRNTRTIRGVFNNGKWYDAAELSKMLESASYR